MLARFHREVRAARLITHANVCRVHDIAETPIGRRAVHFLSMEYIDGEDLARQLCLGLAAAHDAGMVHRDLKPANIMLDARGRARITDFGLSGLAEEFRGEDPSGTPAYMAPEQLHGAPATTASDIYALGLVLYEVFTGKHPFEARNIGDLIDKQEREIRPPSSRIRDIDSLVERAILRCLAKEPGNRPRSPYEIAAALPGGDPLAAALEAGETPSPEMVAAAGETEGIQPLRAWALVLAILVVLLLAGWVFNPAKTQNPDLEKSPEVLRDQARTMLRNLGISTSQGDSAYGLQRDEDFPENHGPGWARFIHRESPQTLLPASMHIIGPFFAAPPPHVSDKDPPPLVPGMTTVVTDGAGRLLELTAVPPLDSTATNTSNTSVDWSALQEWANLNPETLMPVQPERGNQVAWTARWIHRPEVPLRVEASSHGGIPTYLAVFGPWSTYGRQEEPWWQEAVTALTIVVVSFVMLAGALLAWRNLKSGRADRGGAFRLALFAFSSLMLAWLFASDHRFDPQELNLYLNAVAVALYWSVLAGVMYLAVEPFVRRRWPHALISWNRLLEGRFGDVLVGRDALIGIFFAALVCIARTAARLSELTLPQFPDADIVQAMHSTPQSIAFLLRMLFDSANISLALFFLYSFFKAALRSVWLATPLWILLIGILTPGIDPAGIFVVSLFAVLWLVAVLRFGLMAGMAMWFADRIFRAEGMLTPDGWYAGQFYVLVGSVAVLAIYAFKNSLGNNPILSFKLIDGYRD